MVISALGVGGGSLFSEYVKTSSKRRQKLTLLEIIRGIRLQQAYPCPKQQYL